MRDELRAVLDEATDPSTELNGDEQWLLRHLAAVAAILPDYAELYRNLLARCQAEGMSVDLQDIAFEAAGTIATLMLSLNTRRPVVIAAGDTPIDPSHALGTMDQVFSSLILLTGPTDDDYSEAMLTVEELDELMTLTDVPAWLEQLGATE